MWEIEKISKGICLCFLAICSWQDIKRQGNIRFFPVGGKLTGDCKFYLPRQGMLEICIFQVPVGIVS